MGLGFRAFWDYVLVKWEEHEEIRVDGLLAEPVEVCSLPGFRETPSGTLSIGLGLVFRGIGFRVQGLS